MSKVTNFANPTDVRTWAAEQGIAVGKRGLFSETLIKAYNKAHKSRPYKPGGYVKTVPVVAKRQGKPPVRRNVSQAAARKWASENGHTVGKRGLVPTPVLQAYALALSAK